MGFLLAKNSNVYEQSSGPHIKETDTIFDFSQHKKTTITLHTAYGQATWKHVLNESPFSNGRWNLTTFHGIYDLLTCESHHSRATND